MNWIKNHMRALIIAVVVVGVITGISVKAASLENAEGTSTGIQGTVEAKSVSINTKIPGRVVEFYVTEGDIVKAGDPLLKISSDEIEAKKLQLEAQISQAQAGVDAAAAVVEMANANYNISLERVEQAKAGLQASKSQRDMASAVNDKATNGARTQQVAQAESAYTLWEGTYERALALYEGGAISKQKLEEISTQKEVAAQTLSMAREGAREEDKEAAASQLSMAQAGVEASEAVLNQAMEASNAAMAQVTQAQAGLVAAQGLLSQAEAGLMEVDVYLEDTMLVAPIDGTVTVINVDEGELVSTGTAISTIADLSQCYVTVNVDEDDLASVHSGQEVSVRFLAYGDSDQVGTITAINALPDFAVKKATSENGEYDIVTFGVKIELDNGENIIHPGMSAIVDFE